MQATTAGAPETDLRALREELDHALEQLPARYRLPLMLFHFEEQSLAETARVLGLKASAASARLVRGREMLRAKLVRRGVAVGSVGALTALLSAEAGAAVLPATFVSATVEGAALAAAGKLAAGVGSGIVSAKVAALTEGAEAMLFIGQVKSMVAGVAIGVAVAGAGLGVGAAVAANNGREAAAPPPAVAAQTPAPVEKEAALFSSRAWLNDEASRDLAHVGIRVFSIGDWYFREGPWSTPFGWATPAELRRRPMPAADYVNAWAASQGREVLWLSNNTVAIIGTKAELEALQQRAGGESASAEAIIDRLAPNDGRPPVGGERPVWDPEQDQATLRKAFDTAQGQAKVDAAIALCAAGGDDGLAFLKSELAKPRASTDHWKQVRAHWKQVRAVGAHGGAEALALLKAILLERSQPLARRAGLALNENGSDAAVEILRVALQSNDADTAYAAAGGLETLGGKAGLELSALALAHADPKVRRDGIFGAYRANGERALPLIEKALADPDAEVRKEAMRGVNRMGERALPLMEKALVDTDASVRKAAVAGLNYIATDRATALLRRQLTTEKDPAVLDAVEKCLQQRARR